MCIRKIVDKNGREVDDGVLTVFRAPKSYTGENVCEISCHGGIYVTKKFSDFALNRVQSLLREASSQRGLSQRKAFTYSG